MTFFLLLQLHRMYIFKRGIRFPKTMKNILILPATDDERNWAALLLATSEPWITLGISLEKCTRTCHDPVFLLFIAHINNEACGVVILDPKGMAGSPYLKSIAVSEGYRDKHIGGTLLLYAEDFFRKEAHHFFLCVSSFNTKDRRFYERNGYEAVGELKDYIIRGASEIIMHKSL